jgi:hypothetical protein
MLKCFFFELALNKMWRLKCFLLFLNGIDLLTYKNYINV